MKRLIFILLVAMALSSCSDAKMVDYDTSYELCLENKSSHSITITLAEDASHTTTSDLPGEIVLDAGESFSDNVLTPLLCSDFGKAVFDDEVSIDYQTAPWSAYNISRDSNYSVYKQSEYHYICTYTFTDADYQYALENGAKLKE